MSTRRAADRGGGQFSLGPNLLGRPLLHNQKEMKYSIDSHPNTTIKKVSESSCVINTIFIAEMTPTFNLSDLILKIFQQSERYIAIKYKLAEITLKFNLKE